MFQRMVGGVLLLLLVTWQAHSVPVTQPPTGSPGPGAKAGDVGKALDEVLGGKASLDRVRIDVQWYGDAGQRSVVIHGKGKSIWNREKEFDLPREKVLECLTLLRKSGFSSMPDRFGGLAFPGRGPRPGVPERLAGSVTLTIGSARKSVMQLGGGEQSKPLADLAANILRICSEPGRAGVGAADVTDGLKKVGRGDLTPTTLHALVHRLPEGKQKGSEGWLMRIQGQAVITRPRDPVKGYGTPMRLELSPKQLQDVIQLLVDNDAGNLPINLYAVHYTDFVVGVLNHERNLQARQFAGLTPQKYGEKQKQFDRIFEGLHKLHQLAIKEGQPEKEPE